MFWKPFSAVLLAGLLIFGIYRWDVQQDRNAAQWDKTARLELNLIAAARQNLADGERDANDPNNPASLPACIKVAEDWLKFAPSRATLRDDLRRAIEHAKTALAPR